MNNPLHAAFYADVSLHRRVTIAVNDTLARDTKRVRFSCPEIARRITPGQFLMVRVHGINDPLIGRALAVYDVLPGADGNPDWIDLVYHVKGKFTRQLSRMATGQGLQVWGPLGNGFPVLQCQHLIMVAGGIGQTPFLILAKEHLGLQQFGDPPRTATNIERITLCYGAASADRLAGVDDFRQLNVAVELSTDDGSAGRHGLVTEQLQHVLENEPASPAGVQIVCCGPTAMMKATTQLAADRQIPCLVSLETLKHCIEEEFEKRPNLIPLNIKAMEAGIEAARQ